MWIWVINTKDYAVIVAKLWVSLYIMKPTVMLLQPVIAADWKT